MIKIWYEDINWVDDAGQIIPMSSGQELILNCRLTHMYRQPVITEDTWNGRSFPAQINIHESYMVEMAQREISLNDLNKLQSCKKIYVTSLDTNEIIEVDTDSPMLIEPGERYGTAHQLFTWTFQTRKISTYPAYPRLNTYELSITVDSVESTYYTDFEAINFILDSELAQYNQNDGMNRTSKIVTKKGKRLLFYLFETDAIELKELIEQAYPEDVLFETVQAVETPVCTIAQLAEALYRVDVQMITSVDVNYLTDAAIS